MGDEITNDEFNKESVPNLSFEAIDNWLEAHGQEKALTILTRNALRLLPHVSTFYEEIDRNFYYLPHHLRQSLFRSILLSTTFIHAPSDRIRGKASKWYDQTNNLAKALDSHLSRSRPNGRIISVVSGMNSPLLSLPFQLNNRGEILPPEPNSDGLLYSIQLQEMLRNTLIGLPESEFGHAAEKDMRLLEKVSSTQTLFATPLWHADGMPYEAADAFHYLIQDYELSTPTSSFWREWYQGFLDGKPLDWELQRRVVLIPDEDWKKGPGHIARLIEEIRSEFEAEQRQQPKPLTEKPVSPEAAKAMAQKLKTNRDAIALTSASALEQIAEFREVVRGNNQLDPEFRERLLGFLDELTAKLQHLHSLLPSGSETPSEETGEQGVRWLRDFKASFFKEAAEYASPDNVARSIIPTGIILTCTGVGTLMGMPVAGTVVGGLITGQIKPGKAADDLLNPRTPASE